jgi:hypothetical protein
MTVLVVAEAVVIVLLGVPGMTVLVVAEAVVIVLLGILVIGLMRRNSELLRDLQDEAQKTPDPAGTGTVARDIAGVGLNGQIVGVKVRYPDKPTLLAFMSTRCATCSHFWRRFGDSKVLATLGDVRLIIVTYGEGSERPADVAEVLEIAEELGVPPHQPDDQNPEQNDDDGFGNDEDGHARDSAPNWDGLLQLIGQAAGT